MRNGRVAGAMLVAVVASIGMSFGQEIPEGGCSWLFKAEADTVNVAYPDDSANYWVTRYNLTPDARLVIRGQYPAARYLSFHVYDEASRPIDSLADFELDPDESSINPFRSPSAEHAGSYTAYVEFGPRPANPEPNTFYSGDLYVSGDQTQQNPAGMIIYRVYVSDDPDDIRGGVPLPTVALQSKSTGQEIRFGACQEAPPPSTGETLTNAIADANFPQDVADALRGRGASLGSNPPTFAVFYGLVGDRGGFYSNQHIAYMQSMISRRHGDLVVFRAKAPTAPHTRAGQPIFTVDSEGNEIRPDLRYWSICQTNFATQRYVRCAADFESAVDEEGFFTFVISDPAHRPSNATAENGVTWLPWGGIFHDGMILYRHMLPAAGFPAAIHNVPQGTSPRSVLGDYYPDAVYCTRPLFESGGSSAAASFEACRNGS